MPEFFILLVEFCRIFIQPILLFNVSLYIQLDKNIILLVLF